MYSLLQSNGSVVLFTRLSNRTSGCTAFIGSSTSSDAVEQNAMQCSLSLAALYLNTVYCNIKVGAKLQCTFYQCNLVLHGECYCSA